MNVLKALKEFIVGFIVGPFSDPDDDGLKAERVQWWEDLIVPAWQKEKGGRVLSRTFILGESGAAGDLAMTVTGELEQYGYHPDVGVAGNAVTVRLRSASAGQLTERDYAAAALIDFTC